MLSFYFKGAAHDLNYFKGGDAYGIPFNHERHQEIRDFKTGYSQTA